MRSRGVTTINSHGCRRCPRPGFALAAMFAVTSWGIARAVDAPAPAAVDEATPSFRQDIMPIVTRYGCNSGGCHGKLAGQNGFKLSLRGYAPEWDHPSLIKDLSGRRIDYARPEASLLVAK